MIWRGPIVSGVIRQFYEQVLWSDLDFLLIDLPPGTSDAPLTVLQSLSIDGVVLVTMPQALATMIVRKAANLVAPAEEADARRRREHVVLHRARYRHAATRSSGRRTPQRVAELAQAPVLARIPIDPNKARLADEGRIEEIDDPVCDELAGACSPRSQRIPNPKRRSRSSDSAAEGDRTAAKRGR